MSNSLVWLWYSLRSAVVYVRKKKIQTPSTLRSFLRPSTSKKPTARLVLSPPSSVAATSITFDGSSSFAAPGQGGLRVWAFTSSDGFAQSGNQSIITHPFTAAGVYTVSLIVTDKKGQSSLPASMSITIAATPPAPDPPPQPPPPTPQPPNAPSFLIAPVISSTQVNLSWTDNSPDEAGFKIERRVSGGTFAQIGTTGANVTTYPNQGLTAGTSYEYRVRAFNGNGDSTYSNTASATTPTAPTPPSTGCPAGGKPMPASAMASATAFMAWLDANVVANDFACAPAGTYTWTDGNAFWFPPANVQVLGAGSRSTFGGGNVTVIVDNYASGNPLLRFFPSASGTFRLAGFTWRGGSIGANTKSSGVVVVGDGSAAVSGRIDHNTFDASTYDTAEGRNSSDITLSGFYGVTDSNSYGEANNNIRLFGVATANERYAEDTGLGGPNFTFIEDNTFGTGLANDCQGAGKMVWRYNTFTSTGIQTHPTGGQHRGCRAWELYNNTWQGIRPDPPGPYFTVFFVSGGTGVVWGNNVVTNDYKSFFSMYSMRRNDSTYTDTEPPNGWGYCGPTPRSVGTVNVSGTAVTKTAGSNFNTLWPSGSMIFINGVSRTIASVSSTSALTLTASGGTQTGVSYTVGSNWDGDQDLYGYPCMDQPGQGKGDLLTGDFPNVVNSATGGTYADSTAWPRQQLEPTYEWNNTFTPALGYGGAFMSVVTGADVLHENRDYFLNYGNTNCTAGASSCTAGVGTGTLAQRPSQCTPGSGSNPGVGWWATDTQSFYRCTALNTWTLYYQPYTYPHPLRSSLNQ